MSLVGSNQIRQQTSWPQSEQYSISILMTTASHKGVAIGHFVLLDPKKKFFITTFHCEVKALNQSVGSLGVF